MFLVLLIRAEITRAGPRRLLDQPSVFLCGEHSSFWHRHEQTTTKAINIHRGAESPDTNYTVIWTFLCWVVNSNQWRTKECTNTIIAFYNQKTAIWWTHFLLIALSVMAFIFRVSTSSHYAEMKPKSQILTLPSCANALRDFKHFWRNWNLIKTKQIRNMKTWIYTTAWNDRNHLWEKNDLTRFWHFSLIPTTNMEYAGFMFYTAASHQGAIETLCPHFWGALMSAVFKYSLRGEARVTFRGQKHTSMSHPLTRRMWFLLSKLQPATRTLWLHF